MNEKTFVKIIKPQSSGTSLTILDLAFRLSWSPTSIFNVTGYLTQKSSAYQI
jgi:hypothetical protein